MRIQIQPIPFGLDDQIVSIELQWGIKPVFEDTVRLTILQFNEGNNLIAEKVVEMTTAEYMAKGETKEDRMDAILDELGIVKLESDIFE